MSHYDQQAKPISDVSVYSLWSSFLILRYIDHMGNKAWMWVHQNETSMEGFRKLKVLATIGRLEQKDKRVL
ncbi:hypothetical protein HF888_04655 [Bermanella marisrubri]|nr:hypothetical protein [Bermanella marisrubri]QIZ83552.1 hypothetical protein HF888_04655 [Bermanella marisrubri]